MKYVHTWSELQSWEKGKIFMTVSAVMEITKSTFNASIIFKRERGKHVLLMTYKAEPDHQRLQPLL